MFDFLSSLPFLDSGSTGSLSLTIIIVIVVAGLIVGILSIILGVYLIRRGFVNDSLFITLIGIFLTGFWIGVLAYYFAKNSLTLIKERNEKFSERAE